MIKHLFAALLLSVAALAQSSSTGGGVSVSGSPAANDCVKFVSSTVITTAGGPCSAGGGGTVTTVGFTGGLISVGTPTTTPAFTVAGTSGGIPYFSGAAAWSSSGVLTANGVVLGGGAGTTPTVTAADSTTTHALFATAGAPAFRALVAGDLPATNKIRGFGANFTNVSNAQVAYGVVPYACTISAWNIMTDATAATFKVWVVHTGTAVPTVSNNINTNGVAISTGTAIHSTTVTDFAVGTGTAIAANDMFTIVLSGVTGSPTFLNAFVECDQ